MSNMKVVSLVAAENKMQTEAIGREIERAIVVIDDEIETVVARFQNQINELKQRVAALEGVQP